MKIEIKNGNVSTTIDIDALNGQKMIEAIKNCLDDKDDCNYINYSDKISKVIFPKEYLKNSLIIIPNN